MRIPMRYMRQTRPPASVGSVLVKANDPNSVEIRDALRARKGLIIKEALSCDEGGSDTVLPLRSFDVVSGSRWRGWMGIGSAVFRVYEGLNRRITQEITIGDEGLSINQSTEYLDEVKTEKDGFKAEIKDEGPPWDDKNPHVLSVGDSFVFLEDNKHFGLSTYEGDSVRHSYFLTEGSDKGSRRNHKHKTRSRGETDNLTFIIGSRNSFIPLRLLMQPNGRDATIAFCNHADLQRANLIKAVMMGASDEEHPAYGKKGFIPRGIRTSWSTFYFSERNNPGFADDADLLEILQLMRDSGHHILPHSTRNGPDTRQDLIDAMPHYETEFQSREWIDHSLSDGALSAGLSSKGWDSESEYYSMDLFENHGYEYAWAYRDWHFGLNEPNYSRYIDFFVPSGMLYIDIMFPDVRFGFPNHLMYQNESLAMPTAGPLWLYTTFRTPVGTFQSRVRKDSLSDLVDMCGVSLCHEYFAASLQNGAYFDILGGGDPNIDDCVIREAFDNVLVEIESLINEGRLWNPTIVEFGDYFRKLKQIRITYSGGKKYILENNCEGPINGVTFLAQSHTAVPKVNGATPNTKNVKRGIIFWFDLAPGTTEVTL